MLTVEVRAITDTVNLTTPSLSSSEDGIINLNISSSLIDSDTSETQTIFISHLTGASLSAGTMLNHVWTLDSSQLSGLKLTPITHSDLDFTIKVTTLSVESAEGTTALISDMLAVELRAVADTGIVTIQAIQSISEDEVLNLNISSSLIDLDTSETQTIFIGSITGASLSAGTMLNHVWTLDPSQLSGLKLTPTAHSDLEFTIKVTTLSKESADGATALISDVLAVEVRAITDTGIITIQAVQPISEDEVLDLNISSSLIDIDTSETQTIFIGSITGASLSAGTMLNHVWTLDPSQLSGLKLTPTTHSDLDFTIKVTTLSKESAESTTALISDMLTVEVRAVADTVNLATPSLSSSEDEVINLNISSSLIDSDTSETQTIFISHLTGASLSAGTMLNHVWTLDSSQLSGLKLTPIIHSDIDFTIKVTTLSAESAEGTTALISDVLAIELRAIADTGIITIQAIQSISEDEVLNLNISSSLIDIDTSETQTIFIGSITGASLSAGTMLNDVWTLDPSQLSGLKLTPTTHSDLEFTIKVTTLSKESAEGTTALISDMLSVEIRAITDTAIITIQATQSISEDEILNLNISSSLIDIDTSETQTIFIGFITGASLSAGTMLNNVWTLDPSQLSGLKLTPTTHSDLEFTIKVTTLSKESAEGTTALISDTLAIEIRAVADTVNLTTTSSSSSEENIVNLNISSSLIDLDGSETQTIFIGNLTGASLSAGTMLNHVWTLDPSQLSGLKLTPIIHSDIDFTIKVTTLSAESAEGTTALISDTLAIELRAVADTGIITIQAVQSISEDEVLNLNISSSLIDIDTSETQTIFIGSITGASLSAGTMLNNVWTLDPSQLSGLKLTPTTHSDLEFTIKVTTLSKESAEGTTALISDMLAVEVRAITDSVNLTTPSLSSSEDGIINLNISSSLIDSDTSETQTIFISHLTGASLSAGTMLDHVWTLDPSQLSGLKLTPIIHSDLEFTIKVTTLSAESAEGTTALISDMLSIELRAVADTRR